MSKEFKTVRIKIRQTANGYCVEAKTRVPGGLFREFDKAVYSLDSLEKVGETVSKAVVKMQQVFGEKKAAHEAKKAKEKTTKRIGRDL